MNDTSAAAVSAYWAATFGCTIADLRPSHGHAYVHAQLAGYRGVQILMFDGAAPIISVPDDLLAPMQHVASTWQPGHLDVTAQVTSVLGERAGLVVGPAVLAYADDTTLRTVTTPHQTRLLERTSTADCHQLQAFADDCSPDEWEAGGSNIEHDVVFGTFVETTLVAVAGYEVWGNRLAHIAIIAHPTHRGNAFGTSAVLAASRHAITAGVVPQYRALQSNHSARRLAAGLGFAPLAMSLAVRLRA